MKYIASFSGGKDSTATIILAHENGEPLDLILFSEVMFDENISGELPEHIDFIKNVCIPQFEKWGYETKILHSETTYIDIFFHTVQRSKAEERNGKRAGFPMAGKCAINRSCKIKAIKQFFSSFEEEYTQYIGIATDKPKRLERIDEVKKVSLLKKYGYTEQMAYELCKEYKLLSPVYDFTKRGGCWFCPNARINELRHLRKYHQELWGKLIDLENEKNLVGNIFNKLEKKSIHDIEEKLKWEDRQFTIFDFIGGNESGK